MYLDSPDTDLCDPADIDELKLPSHLRLKDDTELDLYLSDISWLWPGYIPRRFVTALIAAPGMGKSAVALDICRTLLNGGHWPCGTPCEALPPDARLLWLDMDGTLPVFRHRVLNWEMPRGRFIFPFYPLEHLQIDNEFHWKWVEAVCDQKSPALLVIDSLTGLHNRGESNSTMRTIMKTLASLAHRTGIAVLVIHHLNKSPGGAMNYPISVHRARGASIITQFCHSVLAIAPHRPYSTEGIAGAEDECRLDVIKANLGPKPPTLAFTLSDKGPAWCEPKPPSASSSAVGKAVAFIYENLKNGSVPSNDLRESALRNDIPLRTLERARQVIGVKSVRRGAVWYSELLVQQPEQPLPSINLAQEGEA